MSLLTIHLFIFYFEIRSSNYKQFCNLGETLYPFLLRQNCINGSKWEKLVSYTQVLIAILHNSVLTYVYVHRCAKRTTQEISVSFLELSLAWNSDSTRQRKMRQTNSIVLPAKHHCQFHQCLDNLTVVAKINGYVGLKVCRGIYRR